jgi:hypothetical protein
VGTRNRSDNSLPRAHSLLPPNPFQRRATNRVGTAATTNPSSVPRSPPRRPPPLAGPRTALPRPTAPAAARRGRISRSLAVVRSRFVGGVLPRRRAQARRCRCLPRAGRQLGAHKMFVEINHYDLMGVPVQVQRTQHRIAGFMVSYYAIRSNDTHDELQNDLIEEWWKWFRGR